MMGENVQERNIFIFDVDFKNAKFGEHFLSNLKSANEPCHSSE
jgi:hypothetical protein